MSSLWRSLAGVLALALVAAGMALSWLHGELSQARARTASAEVARAASAAALRAERHLARQMEILGEEHEQERERAPQVAADVVADLQSGVVRLRRQWRACEAARVSDSAAAAAERDALAELRKRDQGDLVRIGREADQQLRACQAVITAWRTAAHQGAAAFPDRAPAHDLPAGARREAAP